MVFLMKELFFFEVVGEFAIHAAGVVGCEDMSGF